MPGTRLKRRQKQKNPLIRLLVFLLLVAVGLGAALLAVALLRQGDPEPLEQEEPSETVMVGGQEVDIDQSLPQSELEEEHFTRDEDGVITYSGQARYGIDVSSHQEEIDWAAVAGDGIAFAILRIGNRGYSAGAVSQDERFEENYTGATENGIDVGVYFFSQAVNEEEALEEARQVLAWLDGRALAGPVVYDWETIDTDTARTDGVSGETVTACAKVFCQAVQEGGYTPMVYCNGMLGYLSYDLNELEGIGVWYAEYSDYPSFAYALELWQYTNQGTVAGIQGKVDRNIWFSDGGLTSGE